MYFLNIQQIKTMRDIKFDEYNSYQVIQIIEDINQFFLFPDLELITNKTNTFFIVKAFLLPFFLHAILEEKDNNSLSSIKSNNNTLLPRCSIKITNTPNTYGVIISYLAFFVMV